MKRIPVYKYPAEYAREHEELQQYRESCKANLACKEAIQEAIRQYYSDNRLREAGAERVVAQFGTERPLYVLAITVRKKDWDLRFSQRNRDWANTVPVFEDLHPVLGDKNAQFIVNSHPGMVDIFIAQVRTLAGEV